MPSDILLELILTSYHKDKESLKKAMDEAYLHDNEQYWKLLELWSALEVAANERSAV